MNSRSRPALHHFFAALPFLTLGPGRSVLRLPPFILEMAMIQLTGAGKRLGTSLVRKCGLANQPADRVGLVGANGHRKTTMLRVLAGLELWTTSCRNEEHFRAIYHRRSL